MFRCKLLHWRMDFFFLLSDVVVDLFFVAAASGGGPGLPVRFFYSGPLRCDSTTSTASHHREWSLILFEKLNKGT